MNESNDIIEKKFNRFFYDSQKRRMLYIPYSLLTKEGTRWAIAVFLLNYIGFSDFIGNFYFIAFSLGTFFFFVYQKNFNETIQNRETLWLILAVRNYLGLENCHEN